jgi:hypothetical protein
MAKEGRLSVPVTIICMVAGTLSLPVLLPIAWMQHASEKRRMQVAARQTTCVECGCLLTDESLTLAIDLWSAYMTKLQRDHPAVRFRVIRPYDAVCIACGQEYKWANEMRVFQPLQATKLDD